MACFDIAAVGELLIDMLPAGKSPRGNALLEVNPGGAPCNMLAMAAKMGSRCAFIGKVGKDKLGEMLGSTIGSLGIDTRGLIYDPNFTTTIAMVHLDHATGERDFTFVRKPGADIMLTFEEVDKAVIDGANILHFGSVSLTDEPCRSAVKQAVEYALSMGKVISFDPNIRLPLWKDREDMLSQVRYGLSKSHVVKIALDELEQLYGKGDTYEVLADRLLWEYPNIKALFITMGKDGCHYRLGEYGNYFPAFSDKPAVDTTGAGDSFAGACLACIAKHGLDNMTPELMDQAVRTATAAAAIVVGRYGSLKVMPSEDEVTEMLKKHGYR